MLDSLVRVSRRDVPKYHTNNILKTDGLRHTQSTTTPVPHLSREAKTQQQDFRWESASTTAFLACVAQFNNVEQSCWISLMHQRVHYRRRYLVTLTAIQFHTLFTLLPEYFSTFPHGTCLLTVLCIIFSLRGSLSPIFRLYYQTILLVDTIPYNAEWTANGPNTLYGFTDEYLCR